MSFRWNVADENRYFVDYAKKMSCCKWCGQLIVRGQLRMAMFQRGRFRSERKADGLSSVQSTVQYPDIFFPSLSLSLLPSLPDAATAIATSRRTPPATSATATPSCTTTRRASSSTLRSAPAEPRWWRRSRRSSGWTPSCGRTGPPSRAWCTGRRS